MGGEVEVVDDLRSSLIENSSSPEQTLKRTGDSSTAYFFFEKSNFFSNLIEYSIIHIHPSKRDAMDCIGTHNNRSDRSRSSFPCMERRPTRLDPRSR